MTDAEMHAKLADKTKRMKEKEPNLAGSHFNYLQMCENLKRLKSERDMGLDYYINTALKIHTVVNGIMAHEASMGVNKPPESNFQPTSTMKLNKDLLSAAVTSQALNKQRRNRSRMVT